jgi:hypothetical protein
VTVQFSLTTTVANFAVLSADLTSSLFDDSLATGLVTAGLALINGPLVVVEAATVNTAPIPVLFSAPSPPPPPVPAAPPANHFGTVDAPVSAASRIGLGVGLGLGVPLAGVLIFVAARHLTAPPAATVTYDEASHHGSAAAASASGPESPRKGGSLRKMDTAMDV